MGWTGDEDRLKKTSEQLRKEAEGLGKLLKDLKNKEDTASLVRMAEEALGRTKSAQPRDNLLGSPSTPTSTPAEDTSSESASNALAKTITSGNVGGVPSGLEEVLPTPAADLAPIVVQEEPVVPHAEVDEWTQTVREGQKRLV
jgi:hypothetical protein